MGTARVEVAVTPGLEEILALGDVAETARYLREYRGELGAIELVGAEQERELPLGLDVRHPGRSYSQAARSAAEVALAIQAVCTPLLDVMQRSTHTGRPAWSIGASSAVLRARAAC